jgi:hypothetical protein
MFTNTNCTLWQNVGDFFYSFFYLKKGKKKEQKRQEKRKRKGFIVFLQGVFHTSIIWSLDHSIRVA